MTPGFISQRREKTWPICVAFQKYNNNYCSLQKHLSNNGLNDRVFLMQIYFSRVN